MIRPWERGWSSGEMWSGKLCVWVEDVLLWFYRHECRQSSLGMQACRGVENNVQTIKYMNTKVPPLLFLSSCLEALVVTERDELDVIGRVYASHSERYAD